MPEYFETRERALLGSRYDELYRPLTETAARGVTVNGLRCAPEAFAAGAGIALQPSPFCKQAFLAPAEFRPGRHPWHHAGVFYAQEPSAASAAPLLGVEPGMKVCDLCAAPGGKSSQLAAALQGKGLLLANEYVAARAEILRQNLERMGVDNAIVTNETPARLAETLPGYFDRVLVDAPCSGEGMFRKEPAALAQHSEALVRQCAALASGILDAAAELLAPGGVLVFSTCTFSPEEDEAQVAAFLTRHPEFVQQDLSGVGFGRPGEANRAPETPGFSAEFCRRIWPADGGEGHFIARLQKRPDAPQAELPRAGRPAKKGKARENKSRGGAAASAEAWRSFAAEYFPHLAGRTVEIPGELVVLPPDDMPNLGRLHVLWAGLMAGRVQKGRFVPSHALFMAMGAQCTNRENLTLSDPRTLAWLRGEEIDAATAQNGWCAVCVDGFPLGCGKVSGGRIKNHYPKALRMLG
ncbi:RsmB/NOP family class I SAM-dependent RNA methyltransferase [uncultured Gemmiger sp.]|uniref:RsmB/NOP family class I SAM-dependent RNA methyltransferase n=1 Tax=uncultured Gemmiger sp. TaxID=1623490 RepID=UPI0025F70282|nr:RsmB/NOP family class I SAM-dependent RNA methyltransferase [uncultured Gemmiger sp.]